jgi:hypothetical protein
MVVGGLLEATSPPLVEGSDPVQEARSAPRYLKRKKMIREKKKSLEVNAKF